MRRTRSVAEAAAILGCHPDTLYSHLDCDQIVLSDNQRLRVIRLGRRVRVPDIELERLLGEERGFMTCDQTRTRSSESRADWLTDRSDFCWSQPLRKPCAQIAEQPRSCTHRNLDRKSPPQSTIRIELTIRGDHQSQKKPHNLRATPLRFKSRKRRNERRRPAGPCPRADRIDQQGKLLDCRSCAPACGHSERAPRLLVEKPQRADSDFATISSTPARTLCRCCCQGRRIPTDR